MKQHKVNTWLRDRASWLPLAVGSEFPQPSLYSLASELLYEVERKLSDVPSMQFFSEQMLLAIKCYRLKMEQLLELQLCESSNGSKRSPFPSSSNEIYCVSYCVSVQRRDKLPGQSSVNTIIRPLQSPPRHALDIFCLAFISQVAYR